MTTTDCPYTTRETCRVSGSQNLVPVLDLGEQALTGVFPRSPDDDVGRGPLELVWCPDSRLTQLRHTYDPSRMYGDNYGYRSGLNRSMVRHLEAKAARLERQAGIGPGDVVIDIGSNDATLLRSYTVSGLRRIGVDPTGEKFREHYPRGVELVPDFFSAAALSSLVDAGSVRVVTSIAMFYDLPDPVAFARDVRQFLARDGVWHFEQSYLPSMLRQNSYDTICHEHVEYYDLEAVRNILAAAGLVVVDVSLNDVNGGSFAVSAVREDSPRAAPSPMVEWLAEQETRMGLDTPEPLLRFADRVSRHRDALVGLVRALRRSGRSVWGYGASTKGNVLLQHCGFDSEDIEGIAEVNEDKFGRFTPGTGIPIVSEEEARSRHPDYFLVLPWHFRAGILERERRFLDGGGRCIFPFPEIEVV